MKIVKPLAARIKPKSGFSHFFHICLTALLPALVFILVRVGFPFLALALILLGKWRTFAVKPRYWPANIRANAVDIIVGVSLLVFMASTDSPSTQLIWALVYGVWLVLIKPGSGVLKVSMQAFIAQLVGLAALFLSLSGAPILVLVASAWIICYMTARHFLASFNESLTNLLSYMWAYFAAALTWVLSHWLLFYGVLAQPMLLLTVIGFGLSALYFLEKTDRLSRLLQRQFVFVMIAIVAIVVAFSDWGDKAV